MKLERLKKKKWCKFVCYLIIVAFLLEIPMPAYAAIDLGGTAVQSAEAEEATATEEPAETQEPAAAEEDLGNTPVTDSEKPALPDLFGVDSENFLGINTQEKTDDPQEALLADTEREALVELTDQREANVKYFRNTDGSETAYLYNHDVHYKDEAGEYQDIDNSLTEMETKAGKNVLTNEANSADFYFAQDGSEGNLVSVWSEGYNLKWRLQSATESAAEDTTAATMDEPQSRLNTAEEDQCVDGTISSAAYEDILKNVDVEYVLLGTELKENIILNNANVPSRFSFVLTTPSSLSAKETDGQVHFENSNGDVVFKMSEAVMFDAAGAESTDIKVALSTVSETEESHQYKLTIIPAEKWLKDADRVYPIVLDPTVTTKQTATTIYDTHVNSDYPNAHNEASVSRLVGTMTGGKKSRTYLKFVLPTQIQKSDRIVSATMSMHSNTENVNSLFYDYATSGPTMYMFTPKSDWEESTLTWNNQPKYDTTQTVDYAKIEIVNGAGGTIARRGWYDWDVTSVVDGWYNGKPNYGFMIKDTESTQYAKRAYFHSTNDVDYSDRYPMIAISYLNMIGLEDYWTYHTQSAGLAGTGFINDFTGGLTASFEDYSWDSELLSLGVSHVYSTENYEQTQSSLNVGQGFMLSLQERMWRVVINGTELYRYTDGDGTQHYFQYIDGKWTDDSGLNLTMTMPGDGHLYVTDKQDNVRKFNSSTGYLEEIKDNDGNKITIEYSGSGYLSHAYDDAGHMVTFNRNSNNRLGYISIKDRANPNVALKQIFYTYDATGHLTEVKFPGKSTVSASGSSGADNIARFGYTSSGTLNSLIDATNGMHVDYAYDSWANSNNRSRVNEFKVYNSSGQVESSYTMAYSSHCTRFNETKPALGRNQVYVFNYMGQTISAQDQDGNALFCETGMSGGAKNKVTFASKAQQTITNLLKNHDFENGFTNYNSITTGNYVDDTSNAFCGSHCLKVVKSSSNSTLEGKYQSVAVRGGQFYTLSAYVKTSGCSTNGAVLKLDALSGSTTVKTAETDKIVSENGYMRFETTIDLSSYSAENTYTLKASFGMKNAAATVYFDSVQLETGKCANRYNLIENGNLESGLDGPWTVENKESYDGLVTETRNQTGNCYQFYGNAEKSKKLYQTVPVNGTAGNSFVFGCWVKSTGLQNKDNGNGTKQCLGMTLKFNNTDGTATYQDILITPTAVEWQYICTNAVANKNFSSVTVYLKFNYNRNYVWFDDVQLYKDSFGDSFMYDSKGNVISVVDKASNTASAAVNGNNDTTSYTDGKGQSYTFQYDGGNTSAKNHNLTQSKAPDNTKSNFTYDSHGNVTTTKQYGNAGTRYIASGVSYTGNGAYKTASTDQRGLETTYNYNANYGLLISTTIPVGPVDQSQTLTTTNTYNEDTRKLTQIGVNGFDTLLQYTYTQNRPSGIQIGSASAYQKYNYAYDTAGNMTSISHSSSGKTTPSILESYAYLSGRGLKASQTYANNQTLNYAYDSQDRLIGVSTTAGPISKYEYNSNGLVGKSFSYTENGQNPNYVLNQYDLAERLISTYNSKGSGIYDISYDKNNLATGYKSYLRDGSANLEYTTQYAYNECLGGTIQNGVDKPKTDTLKAGSTALSSTNLSYDAYGRLTSMLASAGTSDSHVKIGYAYLEVGTNKTTSLPRHMAIRYTTAPDSTNEPVDLTYYLTYDRAGNITNVENVPLNGATYNEGYTYDSLSRLIAATNVANSGDDYAYAYDGRNNITGSTVTNNGTTTQTKTYTYATDDIDRLTAFSHTTGSGTVTRNYTSDAIGNPTAIAVTDSSDNSTRNFTLSWTQGKLLNSISDGAALNNTYYYDADSNVSKKVLADGSYVVYHYSDGVLEYEEHFNSVGTLQELLKYSYDADGNVEYLLYKDNNFSNTNTFDLYYYVRDAVGNITDLFQIKEQSGSSTTVVNRIAAHYEYDPYGNILSVDKYNNDPIGDINPIRYKDYYYDLQTGWYQLSSRFYDPEVGRFLNADDLSLLTETDSGVVDKNLYAYCDGNPVMRKDEGGQIWNYIVGAALGMAIGVGIQLATNIISGEKLTTGLLTAAGAGALTGALAASGVGLVASMGLNAIASIGKDAVDQYSSGKEFSTGSLLLSGVGGALSGGKGMGKFVNIKTLNKNLTNKLFSGSLKTAKKGLKYYVSQTKHAYRKHLFKPARRGIIVGLSRSGGAYLYNQWRH